MNSKTLKAALRDGNIDEKLTALYGKDALNFQRQRYEKAVAALEELYGEADVSLFTVAGRSEISGNHTDHNHGCVIAASIDLDIIAVAAKTDGRTIRIKSEGFPMDEAEIENPQPDPAAFGTSAAIIAGMCRGFADKGYLTGGFQAYTTSNVLKGRSL